MKDVQLSPAPARTLTVLRRRLQQPAQTRSKLVSCVECCYHYSIMDEAKLDGDLSRQSLERRSVQGVALSLCAQGMRFLLQFLSQILLARLLIPADFGLVAMAVPVLTLAQTIGELGLAQAVIQRATLTKADMSLLFWLGILINVGLAVLMLTTAPMVALFYGQPRLTAVLAVFAGMLVLNGIAAQHMAIMARQMRFARMAVIDVACLLAAVAAGISSALAGLGYWSLVVMQVSNIAVIALLASILSGWRPSLPARASGVRSMLAFGAHLTGYNLVTYAGSNLDSVLIGAMSGSVGLGFYDRSMKLIVTPLWQLSMPLARVATGLLSRLQTVPADYRRAYLAMLRGLLVATAPGFACGALMAGTLVPAVLGPQWVDAAPVVAWLCASAILVPFGVSAFWLFVSQARVQAQLRWACIRTGLSLAALVIGLHWGIIGVAAAYAVTSPLVQGSMVWGATRQGAVRLQDIAIGTYPILLCTAIGTMMAYWSADWLPIPNPFAKLLASLVVIYATGTASLLCFPAGIALIRDVATARHALRRAAPT